METAQSLEEASRKIQVRAANHRSSRPFLVALDGPAGSGKSHLGSILKKRARATVVPSDDFFAAQITDAGWDQRGPAERARDCIDWHRIRSEALEPLLAGESAAWYPFDFARGPLPAGGYALSPEPVRVPPSSLIVLEGAYSCRPELSDLIDLRVLVDAPMEVRHRRLADREEPEFLRKWHARWDSAEDFYFEHISPRRGFDLLVENG
ncbi:MAG: hypothetical protein Q8W46_08305 [Candidatus Palauibacterales bacterium]|nr:hypothetical protein [Candidatus Palauibacterales bacterium]